MRILCIGGGPAGLYFALLHEARGSARTSSRVVERNRPYDTFGWGVVFSDQTLGNLEAADPRHGARDRRRVQPLGRHRRPLQGPHDHLGRPRLLRHRPQAAAQHPAAALRGARRRARVRDRRRPTTRPRRASSTPTSSSRATASTAASADATPATLRARRRSAPLPLRLARHEASCSTRSRSRSRRPQWGWFQAHAYQYDGDTSTFIVETPEDVVAARRPRPRCRRRRASPSASGCSRRYLDGHALMTNATHLRGSAIWIRFPRVVCRTWMHWMRSTAARCRSC